MIQQFYFLNIYPKKLNQYFEKICGTPCSCGIFTTAKIWKQLSLLTNNENVIYTQIQSQKKKKKPVICYILDEPRGRYAKCNKPDTEIKTLHDLAYM